jgi:hypothetical protein
MKTTAIADARTWTRPSRRPPSCVPAVARLRRSRCSRRALQRARPRSCRRGPTAARAARVGRAPCPCRRAARVARRARRCSQGWHPRRGRPSRRRRLRARTMSNEAVRCVNAHEPASMYWEVGASGVRAGSGRDMSGTVARVCWTAGAGMRCGRNGRLFPPQTDASRRAQRVASCSHTPACPRSLALPRTGPASGTLGPLYPADMVR